MVFGFFKSKERKVKELEESIRAYELIINRINEENKTAREQKDPDYQYFIDDNRKRREYNSRLLAEAQEKLTKLKK